MILDPPEDLSEELSRRICRFVRGRCPDCGDLLSGLAWHGGEGYVAGWCEHCGVKFRLMPSLNVFVGASFWEETWLGETSVPTAGGVG